MHRRMWHAIVIAAVVTGMLAGPAASLFLFPELPGQPGYETISPSQAYDLLIDSSSVEIPIDVRTDGEWQSERIDTPYPEFPRHFAVSRLDTQSGMQTFKDTYGNATVIVYCRSGGRSSTAAGLLDAAGYPGTVYNMQGGILAWQDGGYPTKTGNTVPEAPAIPQGPSEVHAGTTAVYTTSAVDPDDDVVRYGWDWDGDSSVDTWTDYQPSSMPMNTSHVWLTAGTFTLQVAAEDNVGDLSSWTSLEVTVTSNPPDPPVINGPANGTKGEPYEYTFLVDDADGDQLYLWVEWNQSDPTAEWIGPYTAGETVTLEHTWNQTGTYTIQAKTRDSAGMESDWATLQVSMPLTHLPWWELLQAWLEHLFLHLGGGI